jgi:hypothetical protein
VSRRPSPALPTALIVSQYGSLRFAEHAMENQIDVLEVIPEVEVFRDLRVAEIPFHVIVGF